MLVRALGAPRIHVRGAQGPVSSCIFALQKEVAIDFFNRVVVYRFLKR